MTQLMVGLHAGLRGAADLADRWGAMLRSVGVDAWGVDYGLVDERGYLLEDPICYRDERTDGVMQRASSLVSREALFRATSTRQG